MLMILLNIGKEDFHGAPPRSIYAVAAPSLYKSGLRFQLAATRCRRRLYSIEPAFCILQVTTTPGQGNWSVFLHHSSRLNKRRRMGRQGFREGPVMFVSPTSPPAQRQSRLPLSFDGASVDTLELCSSDLPRRVTII
jgi:hypothetical protein